MRRIRARGLTDEQIAALDAKIDTIRQEHAAQVDAEEAEAKRQRAARRTAELARKMWLDRRPEPPTHLWLPLDEWALLSPREQFLTDRQARERMEDFQWRYQQWRSEEPGAEAPDEDTLFPTLKELLAATPHRR